MSGKFGPVAPFAEDRIYASLPMVVHHKILLKLFVRVLQLHQQIKVLVRILLHTFVPFREFSVASLEITSWENHANVDGGGRC